MAKQQVIYDATPRRAGALPPRWIAGPALVLCIIIAGTIGILVLRDTFDPQVRTARQIELARQAQIDQALTPVDTAVEAGWRILPLLLVAGAAIVGGIIAYRRWAIPAHIEASYEVRKLQAIHQPGQLPATLTSTYSPHTTHNPHYSPHTTYSPRTTHSTSRDLPALPGPTPGDALDEDEEETKAAPLPDNVLLSDVLPSLPRGKLVYGVLPGNKPLLLPLAAGYHMLAHGDTRSGKTNWIDGMICQLHHQARYYDLQIVAGDFKRELAATWRRSALMATIETDPKTIADMLEQIVNGPDGILDRYSHFEQLGERTGRIVRNIGDYARVTNEQPQLTFVIVDELNAVLEACDKKIKLAGALKQALQTGAGAGVYILGGAQYLSSRIFQRDGSKQFVTRCHFGSYDQVAVKMMFSGKIAEDIRELVTGQPGRGLIRTVSQAEPSAFQALRCDEQDILDAIYMGQRGQETVYTEPTSWPNSEEQREANGTAQETMEMVLRTSHIIEANEQERKTNSTDSQAAPNISHPAPTMDKEKYYGVKYLRSKGLSKSAIIKELWGKTGRNYQAVNAEYEAIVQQLEQEGSKQ